MASSGANRLAQEKSPYLLQHASNPVDWYPWGDEAFKKADSEDKPIFLSIGYSTCHWCHVMEKESFEDAEIARLLNRVFVSIKVDREERPDIDNYYMSVSQLLTGTGGWPLTLIMSPNKHPFFAATYLPKESRFGRIGLLELIPQVSDLWQNHRERILRSSHDISQLIQRTLQANVQGEITEEVLDSAYESLVDQYDEENGGFGKAPKFPTPHNLTFLMRYGQNAKNRKALSMVDHTLTMMRMGGVYDQIGFGFHRYSTDADWRVPHFEKMLYDQALLLIAYLEAFHLTGNSRHRRTAEEIVEYLMREMVSAQGGFYSAQDADSEGYEGRFYLWETNEISKLLSGFEKELVIRLFNVQPEGNFREESTRSLSGRNILYMTRPLKQVAAEMGISEEACARYLDQARAKMLAYRSKRTHPHKDKKILCDWNGLTIAALSIAGRILETDYYTTTAERTAEFILTKMRDPEGHLFHRFVDNEKAIRGFLDDYAFLIWGLIELYETTFKTEYLRSANELTNKARALFKDELGGFFFTPPGDDLPMRKKESYDGAIPSGNSVLMINMLRLAKLTGQSVLENEAQQIARHFAKQIQQNPLGHVHMLSGVSVAFSPAPQIVVVGKGGDPSTIRMQNTVRRSRLLDTNVLFRPYEEDAEITSLAPFVKELSLIDNKATAYVCYDKACKKPTNDIRTLPQLLLKHNHPSRDEQAANSRKE